MIPNDRYAMSRDKSLNAITQISEFVTCRAEVTLRDKRSGETAEWEVTYSVPWGCDWKSELSRICTGMGFEVCGFGTHWVRTTNLNTMNIHKDSKDIRE